MGADQETFERHLQCLLDGRPVDPGEPGTGRLPAGIRIVDAVARAHRTALFGAVSADVSVTRRWGHLEIREEIGRGSSGTVYRAWDTRLAREVALKLLSAEIEPHAALEEGRLLARLNHPNIVRVFGADVQGGATGIWMELLDGDTLEDMLARDGAFGIEETLHIGRDLAGAVAAVHAAGLLHRDVKSRNVIREWGGRIVLMDLGAGRTAAETDGPHSVGTPMYMAPEVLAGNPATERSDLYSLGVLLYHLLTSSFPVRATSLDELRARHAAGERQPLATLRPDLPASVVSSIERACHPDADARSSSAVDCEAAFQHALHQSLAVRAAVASPLERWWRRSRHRVAFVAALAAILAPTVWFGWNTAPGRDVRRAAGLTVPPHSTLYLTMNGALGLVRGAALTVRPYNPSTAMPIAVSTDLGVRTIGGAPPWTSGADFSLDGRPVKSPGVVHQGLCCLVDGTTDGEFNYAIRQDSTLAAPLGSRPLSPAGVYRFERDWSNPRQLFALANEGTYWGITYSARSRTFWVTRNLQDRSVIEQWSRDGRHVSTLLSLVGTALSAIAVDPFDDSLWVCRRGPAATLRLENFTAAGDHLVSIDLFPPVEVSEVGGAEFAWVAAP